MLEFNELLEGCRNQDRECQGILYKEFYGSVMGPCVRYSNSRQEAEDLSQDIFIKLFNSLDKFGGDNSSNLAGWIKKVAINHCIDFLRKKKKSPVNDYNLIGDDGEDIKDNSEEYVDLDFTISDITEAVQRLTPKRRIIFNLYVMEGYNHKEISEILECSLNASKSNLFKAKINLRKYLKESNK